MKIRFWFVKQTDKARYYSKLPPERNPGAADHIWIPLSIIEHTTKYPTGQHIVELPEWFVERENL